MEPFGHRRPKISSFSDDLNFTHFQLSSTRGNKQVQKQRKFPNLTSDSATSISNSKDQDQLMFELGLRSSKQSSGIPMKKLLAREMSKEIESRRRSSSVIARLMGLDGLPPEQKRAEGAGFYNRRSSRRNLKEEPEFKDVFEVSKMERSGGGYSSLGTVNSKLSDAEVAFIQQKFMEAKRFSTDEKLRDSEEFDDTLEVLNSNTDLLLKFLEQPDSLFAKHLHDLQGVPSQSHCGRISVMKSSRTLNNDDGQSKHRSKSPQGHHLYGKYTAPNHPESPMFQLDEKNEPTILPTRIVVLKPNLGKSRNSTRNASSPCYSHHFPSEGIEHLEISGIESRETEIWRKKKVQQDIGFSRHNSRESKEMAKEITRQIKNSFNDGSMKISTSKFRGYAGDESSCDASGSESTNDSDVTTFYRDKQHRRLSSRSSESSVSREAKKRLSERWKLTHGSREVQMVSRGSTLGEMLAISDRETSSANSSSSVVGEGCSEICDSSRPAVWNEPLGISSRDGWKDGCLGNLSRSRSVPASSTDFGSPRIGTRHGSLRRDKYVIPKAVKGNFNPRETSLVTSNQRSRGNKSRFLSSSSSSIKENSDTSPDFVITPHQSSGESASIAMDSSSVLENTLEVNDPKKPSDTELSAPPSVNADVSSGDVCNLEPKEPSVSELGSQAGSKEGDQPSPISVIEAPFADDLSSGSECFESISADLHGLRMQLQLLKLETEAYEEGTMLLSSDDDGDRVSIQLATAEKNLESVYIVDVLVDSGINGADLDTFLATWHSPECPVNPTVFEELEKKYHNLNSWSRAERRLMFDRINLKLLEIHQQYTDQFPWIKKPVRKIIPKWNILELEDSLHKSLVSENKKPDMDTEVCEWSNLRDDFDVIGKEIERLLVDELVGEAVVWV
ncbi:Afadin [Gossypium arboreum]|uniref:Afadin n=1 Tax=Gossypium arboreum TaxID=29729 RepID=A0A0B0P9T2_GOSAR|nr:Afadin [Gossypium arboreum]